MTVQDLLIKTLDYTCFWASPDRKDDLPATTRLAQIAALQKAFALTKGDISPMVQKTYSILGLGKALTRKEYIRDLNDLDYLLSGEFVNDRDKDANKELSERVVSVISSIYPYMADEIVRKPVDIVWLFQDLLGFRKDVYKITYPNGGMLEGFSSGLHYSFYLQHELKEVIKKNLDGIDNTLCMILDPQNRRFTAEEINYPEANLDHIDLDWRMAHY